MPKEYHCLDCGKTICHKAIRCQKCAAKVRNNAPEFRAKQSIAQKKAWQKRGVRSRVCVDCGSPIYRGSTRCKSCASTERQKNQELRQRISNSMKERWSEGIFEDIGVRMTSERMKAFWREGKIGTKRQKERRAEAMRRAWERGAYQSRSQYMKDAWKDGKFGGSFLSPSSLEREFAAGLSEAGIDFEIQVVIPGYNFVYDFKIGCDTLIEIDGEFWHHSELAKVRGVPQKDRKKDGLAKKHGYTLIRIRENDMKKFGVEQLIRDRIIPILTRKKEQND